MPDIGPDQAPGDCRPNSGELAPVVSLAKCEGKSDCVRVCPYDVFEVRIATKAERSGLGFLANLKSLAHKHEKAFVIRPDQCHACGLCVEACPENAIRLLRRDRR